jgi:DNA-binding CsgD family transcriptional regulator
MDSTAAKPHRGTVAATLPRVGLTLRRPGVSMGRRWRGGRILVPDSRQSGALARTLHVLLGGSGVAVALVTGSLAVGIFVDIVRNPTMRSGIQSATLVFCAATTIAAVALARWAFGSHRREASDEADAERAVLTLASAAGGVTSEADIVMKTALSATQVRAAVHRLHVLGLLEPISGAGGAHRVVRRDASYGSTPPESAPAASGLEGENNLDPLAIRYGLTRAETNVLALVATGLSNEEVGDRLFVSPATVRTHLHNVFRKLGVRSRVQATLLVTKWPGATGSAGSGTPAPEGTATPISGDPENK